MTAVRALLDDALLGLRAIEDPGVKVRDAEREIAAALLHTYALGVASQLLWQGAGAGVEAHVVALSEPYSAGAPLNSFNPVTSTPAFYFRLRWTGTMYGDWVERLQILDLSTTTGVRS